MTEQSERNGWWADEGGYRFDFECHSNGAVTVTMTRPDGEPVKATLANFRMHQFWKWYNHVAPLPEASLSNPAVGGQP